MAKITIDIDDAKIKHLQRKIAQSGVKISFNNSSGNVSSSQSIDMTVPKGYWNKLNMN